MCGLRLGAVIGADRIARRESVTSSFVVGRAYTRGDIATAFGGSRRACLPTKEGVVVAACLTTAFNPDAPDVVLCGVGPRNRPMGVALAAHRGAIPFFVKEGVGRWVYRGLYVVSEVLTAGARYDRLVEASGRGSGDVSCAVVTRPA